MFTHCERDSSLAVLWRGHLTFLIIMSTEKNRYYIDPNTQDRLQVTYRVHLVMPAVHDGFVDVEATSENEAAQLALKKHHLEIEWYYDEGDDHAIEVLDVECEEPPENGILIEQGHYSGNASISSLFEEEACTQ